MEESSAGGVIGYCGIYCGLCDSWEHVARLAKQLYWVVAPIDAYYREVGLDDFPVFLRVLRKFATDWRCPGCVAGGGDPGCEIRVCARKRGLAWCGDCPDYPCGRLDDLARNYITLLADNERRRQAGTEAWVAEQEERREAGFVYSALKPKRRP